DDLVQTNRHRSRDEMEYELIDTHVFDEDRYFDVVIEYAKQGPEDISIRISATNHGPDPAVLHLLPTLWFRNIPAGGESNPLLKSIASSGKSAIQAADAKLGTYFLYYEDQPQVLFTNNETNTEKVFGQPNQSPYVKDAFHNYLISGLQSAVNPEQ